jgi:hypothetical protein
MNFESKRLATAKKIPEIYPGIFTESSIRWLIFNEHQNGFHQCVRRVGRKVLIDLDQFEDWIDSKAEGGARYA